jgi:hypothetical protein
MYEFFELLAPHLTRERIDRVRGSESHATLEELNPIAP